MFCLPLPIEHSRQNALAIVAPPAVPPFVVDHCSMRGKGHAYIHTVLRPLTYQLITVIPPVIRALHKMITTMICHSLHFLSHVLADTAQASAAEYPQGAALQLPDSSRTGSNHPSAGSAHFCYADKYGMPHPVRPIYRTRCTSPGKTAHSMPPGLLPAEKSNLR